MNKKSKLALVSSAALIVSGCALFEPQNPMTFFATSAGSGKGADLGGLAGAAVLNHRALARRSTYAPIGQAIGGVQMF